MKIAGSLTECTMADSPSSSMVSCARRWRSLNRSSIESTSSSNAVCVIKSVAVYNHLNMLCACELFVLFFLPSFIG